MRDGYVTPGERDVEFYLAVLWRRSWFVLLSFLGVTTSTLVASLSMTPVYEATTSIQIEDRELAIGTELLKPLENLGGTSRTLLVDPEDDGTFVPCPSSQCTPVSFTDGTLIFDVTGFTTYSSRVDRDEDRDDDEDDDDEDDDDDDDDDDD